MRAQYRDHPWYAHTEEFCRLYDGPAFDPGFEHLPLDAFEPMVRRVFGRVKNSIYVPGATVPTANQAATATG